MNVWFALWFAGSALAAPPEAPPNGPATLPVEAIPDLDVTTIRPSGAAPKAAPNVPGRPAGSATWKDGKAQPPGALRATGSEFAVWMHPEAGVDPASFQAGDLVCLSDEEPDAVHRCDADDSDLVAGVVSGAPALLAYTPNTGVVAGLVPVAILGVVEVAVTDRAGPIQLGEALVSTEFPGIAERAVFPDLRGVEDPLVLGDLLAENEVVRRAVFGRAMATCAQEVCVIPVLIGGR